MSFAGGDADKTYVTSGSGRFVGTEFLRLRPAGTVLLVLGPDNQINGNCEVTVALVNYGVVDPALPGAKLILHCWPKVGPGIWAVTGGLSGQESTLVINTAVAGSGNLVVDPHGGLDVNVHFSLYGTAAIAPGATIEVAKEVMFDVGKFRPLDCPQ